MKEPTLIPNAIKNPEAFIDLIFNKTEFYDKTTHPSGGCFNGLRTDSLMNEFWFRSDYSEELIELVLKLTGINIVNTAYDIDFYAEFHSNFEKEPPVIQQHNPKAETAIIVFLNPDENFQSDITIYSPNMDEFDPYNISDKNNFAVKQSIKNKFNSSLIFDPKEYYSINEWHGNDEIREGNLNLFITVTQKMS